MHQGTYLKLRWAQECGGQTQPEPDKHFVFYVWTWPELSAVEFVWCFSSMGETLVIPFVEWRIHLSAPGSYFLFNAIRLIKPKVLTHHHSSTSDLLVSGRLFPRLALLFVSPAHWFRLAITSWLSLPVHLSLMNFNHLCFGHPVPGCFMPHPFSSVITHLNFCVASLYLFQTSLLTCKVYKTHLWLFSFGPWIHC